jgi:hypothetical protein
MLHVAFGFNVDELEDFKDFNLGDNAAFRIER